MSIFNKSKEKEKEKEEEEFEKEFEESEDGIPKWLEKIFEEDEKKNPNHWIDESDFLVISLGGSLILLGCLLFGEKFNIPDPLFLGAAIFSIYFLLVTSIRKKSILKYIAIASIFPVTLFLSIVIIESDVNISKVNNTLSLLAIGISLMYLPRQKIQDRDHLEQIKLKNDIIKSDRRYIKNQRDLIEKMESGFNSVQERIKKIDDLSEKNDKKIEEIKAIQSAKSDKKTDDEKTDKDD